MQHRMNDVVQNKMLGAGNPNARRRESRERPGPVQHLLGREQALDVVRHRVLVELHKRGPIGPQQSHTVMSFRPGRIEISVTFSAKRVRCDFEPIGRDQDVDVPDEASPGIGRDPKKQQRHALQEHRLDVDAIERVCEFGRLIAQS